MYLSKIVSGIEEDLMKKHRVEKTYKEINEKIKQRKAVVVTAEEIIDIVESKGKVEAARQVDVVTTGTSVPCAHLAHFSTSATPHPG